MKQIFIVLFLLAGQRIPAQAIFTKITDTTNPLVTFSNTAAAYKGAAWVDMDGDNLPDLFASQMFVFRNLGNGQFEQKTNLAGGVTGQGAAGSSWADIDNDGDADAITASVSSGLHLNNGDFTFQVKTSDLPDFANYAAWDCALADIDNNGLLDFTFVHACCNFHTTGPFSCRLFLQTAPGVYTKVSGYEFTDQNKPYTIPVWSDYDLDGDVDLFIGAGPASGSPGPDFCYKNLLKETGTFSLERLNTAPFDALQDGQTYNFPDYDNDGDLDIVLTNYGGAICRLWNNNNGVYQSVTTPFTLQNAFLTNVWGDMDNDGDLDVLISLDADPGIRYYENNNGVFGALKILGTASAKIVGIALADYDNDGDLDAYTNGPSAARTLFRNDLSVSGAHHFIAIQLEGVASNRSGIGAIVRVKTTLSGAEKWQTREVSAHNSFQSQNDLRQHFGLSSAEQIDSLVVRWPSGAVQQFGAMAADQFYRIKEGENPILVSNTQEPSQKKLLIEVIPNPATTRIRFNYDWDKLAEKPYLEIFDAAGKLYLTEAITAGKAADISIETLPKGQYFVRINDKTGHLGSVSFVKN